MSSTPYNPTRETCEYCGKSFICHLPEEYAYKRKVSYRSDFTHRVFFCSWKCLRAWEAAREAEREEKQRQREAKKKEKPEPQEKKQAGAVRPTTEVKTRHTIHRCGVCGKRVAMTSTHCKYCDTEIDWSVYEKEAE